MGNDAWAAWASGRPARREPPGKRLPRGGSWRSGVIFDNAKIVGSARPAPAASRSCPQEAYTRRRVTGPGTCVGARLGIRLLFKQRRIPKRKRVQKHKYKRNAFRSTKTFL